MVRVDLVSDKQYLNYAGHKYLGFSGFLEVLRIAIEILRNERERIKTKRNEVREEEDGGLQ